MVREPGRSFSLHLWGAGITDMHYHAAFCVGSGDQTQAVTPVWQTLCRLSHLASLCEAPCKRRKCQKVLQTLRSSQLASSLWGTALFLRESQILFLLHRDMTAGQSRSFRHCACNAHILSTLYQRVSCPDRRESHSASVCAQNSVSCVGGHI